MKIHRAEGIRKTWFIRTGLSNAIGIIAQFQISRSIYCALAYREKQHSVFKKFTAPLETVSKFVHNAIANSRKK
jgi:hypothetical protein